MGQALLEQLNQLNESLGRLLPEFAGFVTIVLAFLADLSRPRARPRPAAWVTLMGMGAMFSLALLEYGAAPAAGQAQPLGMLLPSAFSALGKVIVSGVGLLAAFSFLWEETSSTTNKPMSEHWLVLACMLPGLLLLTQAQHLLLVFVAIELVSIGSYVLVAFRKEDPRAAEAALKYFLFGAASAGVFFFGLSLVYGLSGSLSVTEIAASDRWAAAPVAQKAVALGLVLVGLSFKITAFPFHFWSPDAYQAAPTPFLPFLTTVPKIAAFWVLFLLADLASATGLADVWQWLVGGLALASMTFGNLGALGQHDVKRLLAWSGVAHTGYLLLGLVAVTRLQAGIKGVVFYLIFYAVFNILAFKLTLRMERIAKTADYRRWKPVAQLRTAIFALPFLVAMIGLTGLPPTAGFIGKLMVFLPLWEGYTASGAPLLLVLLIAGVLNTVISLVYYLRVPASLILRPKPDESPPADAAQPAPGGNNWEKLLWLVLAGAGVLFGFLGFDALLNLVERSL